MSTDTSSKPWIRRLVPWVAAAVGLFCVYLLAGYFLLPRIIRWQATEWVQTKLHKTLTLGEIKVNPFGLKIDISDIALPGPATPMVAVGHLHVDFAVLSLFQSAYGFDEIRIDRPYVQAMVRADGKLNLLELVPPPSPGPSPAVRIDTLSVNQGKVAFADYNRQLHPKGTLTPITFTLKDFHTTTSEGGDFAFDAKSERNEVFSWRGTLSMAPIASRGRFAITGLQMATLYGFASENLPVALSGGQLSLNGDYGFSYGKEGLRLTVAVPRLALNGLAFDGKDTLFHSGVQVDGITASLQRLDVAMSGNTPSLTAAMPQLAVHGVTLTGTGPAKNQTIHLADAVLEDAKLDFAARQIVLGALKLNGLDLPVRREHNGAISLTRFLPAPAKPAAAPAPASATPAPAVKPWTVQLATLALADSAVHVEDHAVAHTARFNMSDIAVTVTGASTDQTKPVNVQAALHINGKTTLEGSGTVTPATRAADVKFALTGMPLRDALPYAPALPAVDLRSGTVDASGTLSLPGGEHPAPRFKGQFALNNLGLYERSMKSLLLGWRSLKVTGIAYRPGHADIARAQLVRPTGRIAVMPDHTLNLAALLTPPGAAPAQASAGTQAAATPMAQPAPAPAAPPSPAPTATKPPAVIVRLKTLDITGGRMDFADYSIDPNFQAPIDALQGSIRNISNAPDTIATIDLKGQVVDQYAPVTVSGTANLLGYDRATDVKLAFRNIELPIFNPYSGRYAGYAIAKGKLTALLSYKIVNRALQADHHVIIDQLEWGSASANKDSASWPVRLATALLKDRHGVIDLDLPVNGSLDDPKFRIGPIIWQIIGNIMEKVVTAPFSFIGSLFADAEKAQFVDFAPGSAVLPAGASESLASLSQALGERPALQLDIPAGPGLREDGDGMADARIDAIVMKDERAKDPTASFATLDADDQHDRLEDLYRDKLGKSPAYPDVLPPAPPPPGAKPDTPPDEDAQRQASETQWLRAQLRTAFAPTNTELTKLGAARGAAIRDAILAKGGLDPARLFLVTNTSGTSAGDHVRFELQLK